jgi:signal transduction histidine kinase
MSRRFAPLRRRLMWAFALYTVFVAGLFGLYAMTFMYAVEDQLLDATLALEADALQRQFAASGKWQVPRVAWIRRYATPQEFPEDLRAARAHEPWRREFPGADGRHYHVRSLSDHAGQDRGWVVAEVSGQLVVRPMRERVFGLMLITAIVLVAVALGVAAWLARRTAAPLARLAASVDGLDPADLPQDIDHGYRDDEVGVLARGLSALTARLRRFVAREREFTRDVSHELRTPLAVMRSGTEHLLARNELDPQVRASVQQVHQSGLQLLQTIDLLLSLARESAADPAPPVRLLPLLERVVVDQATLVTNPRLMVEVDVAPDTLAELPDPALRSLLSNLIGNALAHGADGTLRIFVADGDLVITNPIDPVTAPATFDQRREGSPGSGLGLGIVRRLCERHGIALTVTRNEDRVTARFPLRSMPGRDSSEAKTKDFDSKPGDLRV